MTVPVAGEGVGLGDDRAVGAAGARTPAYPSSADRLQDAIAAQRAALRAQSQAVTDSDLAELQRLVSAQASTPTREAVRSIADHLPAAARVAQDGAQRRVDNLKVHAGDLNLKRLRPPTVRQSFWMARVRKFAPRRNLGDPLALTIVRVGGYLGALIEKGEGKARVTFEEVARAVPCCKETVRRVVRLLESWELLATFNVLERHGRDLIRGANLYLRTMPPNRPAAPSAEDAEDQAAEDAADPLVAVVKKAQRAEYWAPFFGLAARLWGLNTAPARPAHPPPT
jgi:hypothetical protein